MEVDPNYRIGGPLKPEKSGTPWWAVFVVIIIVCCAGYYFIIEPGYKLSLTNWINSMSGRDAVSEQNKKDNAALYSHLGIAPLPDRIIASKEVASNFSVLLREKCDTSAMYAFAKGLAKNKHRREAAEALLGFSKNCGTDEEAIARAYIQYGQINDAEQMIKVANKLISIKSYASRYFYWRALGYQKKQQYQLALNDFITTINLSANKQSVRSIVFTRQAEMYDKLGRSCEAITPIQTWISLEPVNRNNTRARALISDYVKKGNCKPEYAKGSVTLPVTDRRAIIVNVKINGTMGKFLLDTGASFVSLRSTFAHKAGLKVNRSNRISLQSANGLTYGYSTLIDQVSIKNAEAANITAVVMSNKENPFGPGIDGLLGLSFLARFELRISDNKWTISARDHQI